MTKAKRVVSKTNKKSHGLELPVYGEAGEALRQVKLNEAVFGIRKTKPEVVHLALESLLSSGRRPIASTKTRGEVRGGGRKPWKQKGTGRARAGSIRSPLWRGGGVVFGPRSNRNFEKRINKQVRRQAMFMVLSDKVRSGKLFVVDKITAAPPKTRVLNQALKLLQQKLPMPPGRVLLITGQPQPTLVRAGRNLPKLEVKAAHNLNLKDLLLAENLVVEEAALPQIEQTYLK